jgi:hypothetical protein
MTGPQENIKLFGSRPSDAVSGLLPGSQQCQPLLDALAALEVDPDTVGILHGSAGSRILDRTPHGIGERVRQFFENWGYQAEILNLWDEGLRKKESLLVVPASFADRAQLARLFAEHDGHAVFYFGVGHVDSLSAP